MLNNLSQYFKKFTGIIPREKIIKEACMQACTEIIGINLTKDMIRIQHTCIWIRVPGVVRAEIERKKELVLEKINSEHQEGLVYKIQYM